MSKARDVVVVRVSEKGDREDEHFHSPEVQIEAATRFGAAVCSGPTADV